MPALINAALVGLRSRWRALCQRVGITPARAESLYDALQAHYSEPARHYHTLAHIASCLRAFDDARAHATAHADALATTITRDADATEFAIFAHDIIYNPLAGDNEQRSAEWACAALREANVAASRIAAIESMVLATTHAAVATDLDAQLLCDIDLAILAAPGEQFDTYERDVRAEYAWVPGPIFRAKRAAILQGFLDRPAIYATPHLRERWEAAARANLRRSLAVLRGD